MVDTASERSRTGNDRAGNSSPPAHDVALLTQLEQHRLAAILGGDHRTLARLCHRDLAYTHTTALTDDYDAYVGKFRDGFYTYESLDSATPRIVFIDEVALLHGEMRARFMAGETQRSLDNVYLAVWAWTGETWQLLAYAPTARPRPAA